MQSIFAVNAFCLGVSHVSKKATRNIWKLFLLHGSGCRYSLCAEKAQELKQTLHP